MELLTAEKPAKQRKSFRWGVCKMAGCSGRWWEPKGLKGRIHMQAPRPPKPMAVPKAEEFE